MRLSIITINRNNAKGLERTLQSVIEQTCQEFEYVIIDGASTDGSVDVVKKYESSIPHLQWISELDNGIYNAMNKGVRLASGEYIQILNSGDCLASEDVVERMLNELQKAGNPSILYGNVVKLFPDGKSITDKCFAGQEITMLGMFTGSFNHDSAYIHRELFLKYGLYDETLKIVADWKWFMEVIVLGGEEPKYFDVDVTLFDMTGISETNKDLDKVERKRVLEELFPKSVLADYERFAFPMEQFKRLQKYSWAYRIVWLLERCLFKLEKAERKKTLITKYE